jgi:hypothetical protein
MRTFVREKKIYCGEDYLEVDLFNYTKTERENSRRGLRSRKETESAPKQIDWNDYNSRRRFTQIVNANFDENGLHVTLTYSSKNMPTSIEAAEKEVTNFLRRVDYRRKKAGLPPLKCIQIPACVYKKDGVTPARIHHHIIMNGGLDRDEVEDAWRKRRCKGQKKGEKIGYANADRLQPEEAGLTALCEYLAKQTGGKKRYSPSHGLKKPNVERIDPDTPPQTEATKYKTSPNLKDPWSRTNDHRFTRKEIIRLCNDPPDLDYWKERYPGYALIGDGYGFKPVYSETRGWALYLKLRRVRD